MATVLKTRVHCAVLSRLFPRTAASVKRELQGENIWKDNDWMFLNVGSLPYVVEQELRKALPVCEKEPEYQPEPAAPAEPQLTWEQHEAINRKIMEDVAKQSEILRKQQEIIDSGHAQIAAYRNVGLADNQRNADLIREHIAKNGAVFCSISVRAAVEGCRHNLDWVKVAPPAASVEQQPQPELLPNGEPQLPLNASAFQMKHASIAQLRDLSRRKGEGQNRSGWASTRF